MLWLSTYADYSFLALVIFWGMYLWKKTDIWFKIFFLAAAVFALYLMASRIVYSNSPSPAGKSRGRNLISCPSCPKRKA